MWPILMNVPPELENNVKSAIVEWSSLYCQLYLANWWCCWIKHLSLLIFCLPNLYISERGVLKSLNSYISFWKSISFYVACFNTVVGCKHSNDCYFSWSTQPLYLYVMPLFITFLTLKSALFKIIATPTFFLLVLAWYIFLNSLLLIYVCLHI